MKFPTLKDRVAHQNFLKKTLGGFTLLETLVAIAIVLVAISTSFSIVPQGQIAVQRIRNQIIAWYIAQEALEIVHNKRDKGMFFERDWLADEELAACIPTNPDDSVIRCTANGLSNQLFVCAGPCPPLKFIDEGSRRLYGNGDDFDSNPFAKDTIFTRWVEIYRVRNETAAAWEQSVYDNDGFDSGECADPNNLELRVTAHVQWRVSLKTYQMDLSENLLYWGNKFITDCSE